MLDMSDARWNLLKAAHQTVFDPRPLLEKIDLTPERSETWAALADKLYEDGEIGELSYAAVPHLVRIGSARQTPSWELLSLVASIELAITSSSSPPLPAWLEPDYTEAIKTIALKSLEWIGDGCTPDEMRVMLCVLCLWSGLRTYGTALFGVFGRGAWRLLPARAMR
jgi:hypothetical protein